MPAAPALLAILALGCGKDYAPVGPEAAAQTPSSEPAPRTPEPSPGNQAPPPPSPTPQPKRSEEVKARMDLPDFKVSPGDKLVVPVQMMNAEGAVAAGVDYRLAYPQDLLEAKSVAATQTTAGFQLASNLTSPGRVNIVATNTGGGAFLTNDAHMFDVTFMVKPGAQIGAESELYYMRADIAQSGHEIFRADMADRGHITIIAKQGAAPAGPAAPAAPASPAK